MAILGDAAGPKNLAKAIGLVCMFVSAGLLSGPAISGSLYNLAGYTVTWLVALAVLVVGTILQVLMIERSSKDQKTLESDDEESSPATATPIVPEVAYSGIPGHEETSALLRPSSSPLTRTTAYRSFSNSSSKREPPKKADDPQKRPQSVYWVMIRRRRVITALVADILFAMIIASFETTIPLHIKAVFGWQTLGAGLLFLLIQLPSLVLLVPAGWLKDKIGMRYPVTIGFLLFAPSLWLLGLPGADGFKWANRGNAGQIIFIVSLLGIGVWRTLLIGFGAVEVMSESFSCLSFKTIMAHSAFFQFQKEPVRSDIALL
jgi:MFS family permease